MITDRFKIIAKAKKDRHADEFVNDIVDRFKRIKRYLPVIEEVK